MTTEEYKAHLRLQSKHLRETQKSKQLETVIAIIIALYFSTTLVLLMHYN